MSYLGGDCDACAWHGGGSMGSRCVLVRAACAGSPQRADPIRIRYLAGAAQCVYTYGVPG